MEISPPSGRPYSKCPFDGISSEIFEAIVELLELRDRSRLARTSHSLKALAVGSLYSHLNLVGLSIDYQDQSHCLSIARLHSDKATEEFGLCSEQVRKLFSTFNDNYLPAIRGMTVGWEANHHRLSIENIIRKGRNFRFLKVRDTPRYGHMDCSEDTWRSLAKAVKMSEQKAIDLDIHVANSRILESFTSIIPNTICCIDFMFPRRTESEDISSYNFRLRDILGNISKCKNLGTLTLREPTGYQELSLPELPEFPKLRHLRLHRVCTSILERYYPEILANLTSFTYEGGVETAAPPLFWPRLLQTFRTLKALKIKLDKRSTTGDFYPYGSNQFSKKAVLCGGTLRSLDITWPHGIGVSAPPDDALESVFVRPSISSPSGEPHARSLIDFLVIENPNLKEINDDVLCMLSAEVRDRGKVPTLECGDDNLANYFVGQDYEHHMGWNDSDSMQSDSMQSDWAESTNSMSPSDIESSVFDEEGDDN